MTIDLLLSADFDAHYKCYDTFPIRWPPAGVAGPCSECGILLEIWRTGCLVHVGTPISIDSSIDLVPNGHIIKARVTSCEPTDHFGFLVQVLVNPDQHNNWFPESYCLTDLQRDFQCRN